MTANRSTEPRFRVVVAAKFGMCFGVRDAIAAVERLAWERPATVLGELAHNEIVRERLSARGVGEGRLDADAAATRDVVITAHGASDAARTRWREAGYRVTDTTCPLVRKAHDALAGLVAAGRHPVVIGRHGHVEVVGLTGDFPDAVVVENEADIQSLPEHGKLGVVSQTTQPVERVAALVAAMRAARPQCGIEFRDTICRPTKERQQAVIDLCREADFVVVVGGANSNNTRELVGKVRSFGVPAERVSRPSDLQQNWLAGHRVIGVTAGTSTLPESVEAVVRVLREWSGEADDMTGGAA